MILESITPHLSGRYFTWSLHSISFKWWPSQKKNFFNGSPFKEQCSGAPFTKDWTKRVLEICILMENGWKIFFFWLSMFYRTFSFRNLSHFHHRFKILPQWPPQNNLLWKTPYVKMIFSVVLFCRCKEERVQNFVKYAL